MVLFLFYGVLTFSSVYLFLFSIQLLLLFSRYQDKGFLIQLCIFLHETILLLNTVERKMLFLSFVFNGLSFHVYKSCVYSELFYSV